MAIYLYLATAAGLFIVSLTDGKLDTVGRSLKERSLTSVAVSGGTILAGTTEGILRSTDNGRTWHKSNKNLSISHVRWIAAFKGASKAFVIGTEPAGIFATYDAADTWQTSPEVGKLRDKYGWSLPYSPNAGCVRGFAVAESGPRSGRIYAAVEVGGVLFSDDRGRSWRLVEGSDGNPDINRKFGPMIHPDVHSITVHPTSSDLLTAATGGGLFRSSDGGRNWKNIYRCYIRAVWVDPGDPQHIIAGPADGVSRNGRIEASFDGGGTWQPASEGMAVPWPGHMVERFFRAGQNLIAILSNGELWLKPLEGSRWQHVLPHLDSIKAGAAGQ
jgi:photosystem II stability/assembly factor-like uncharacterized protein